MPGVSKTGVGDEFSSEGYGVVDPRLTTVLPTPGTCSLQFRDPQRRPILLSPGTCSC